MVFQYFDISIFLHFSYKSTLLTFPIQQMFILLIYVSETVRSLGETEERFSLATA